MKWLVCGACDESLAGRHFVFLRCDEGRNTWTALLQGTIPLPTLNQCCAHKSRCSPFMIIAMKQYRQTFLISIKRRGSKFGPQTREDIQNRTVVERKLSRSKSTPCKERPCFPHPLPFLTLKNYDVNKTSCQQNKLTRGLFPQELLVLLLVNPLSNVPGLPVFLSIGFFTSPP